MFYTYILSSKRNGTLYIGVTNNLRRRVREHRSHSKLSFTQRYDVVQLMYWEEFTYIQDAIAREKQLKRWNRAWKIRLIRSKNPGWHDLFDEL